MKVKSYFADSVESAMIRARQDLGPDAMLLQSRRAAPESQHLGQYEVVFGRTEGTVTFEQELRQAAEQPGPGMDRLTQEVAELRRQIERTASAIHRASSYANRAMQGNAEALRLFSELIAADVDAELAHEIVDDVLKQTPRASTAALSVAIEDLIRSKLHVDSSIGGNAIALVGPAGAGKTTTLIKLAIRHGASAGRRVRLVSLDSERVGGSDLLRAYAAVLGARFDLVADAFALDQAIRSCHTRDLLLIDTPGFDCNHSDLMTRTATILSGRTGIDIHLVLPLTLKPTVLRQAVDKHHIFAPSRLLFTRLDEADATGSILSECVRTNKPVSFLSDGQRVPEDLRPATPEAISASIAGRESIRSSASAAA